MSINDAKAIRFQYKNWRGELSIRTVLPENIWFGSSEWHPSDQWFMRALDVEKGETRDFALQDIVFEPQN